MILNMASGGGGTGGTLTVTAPAGVTVTVSGNGKVKTRIAGSDGTAVFRGLSSGVWTVAITDGNQSAEKTVTVTADYAVTMAFFSATINVTYPAGSTCTATDGVTNLTAPDTGGSWACVVPNAGTWTVAVTDGTQSKTANVSIAEAGQSESIALSYILYLYNAGDACTDVTGGWAKVADNDSYPSCTATAPTLTMGSSSMTAKFSSGTTNRAGYVHTANKVDLTNFGTLKVTYTADITGQYSEVWFGTGFEDLDCYVGLDARTSSKTVSLDISSVSGSHDIYIQLISVSDNTGSSNAITVKVTSVVLE